MHLWFQFRLYASDWLWFIFFITNDWIFVFLPRKIYQCDPWEFTCRTFDLVCKNNSSFVQNSSSSFMKSCKLFIWPCAVASFSFRADWQRMKKILYFFFLIKNATKYVIYDALIQLNISLDACAINFNERTKARWSRTHYFDFFSVFH